MKLVASLIVGLFAMTTFAEEWTPPEKPDVQAILNEAHDDARKGKYELALAKHVWFHENALRFDPAMTGVRLSFALGYWHDLGKKYPPALEKLKEIRTKTRAKITADDGKDISFEDVHDIASLNQELGEESDTVDLFKFVDGRNPKAALLMYGVAEPALINAKEYALCGKYLRPDVSVRRDLEMFKLDRRFKANPEHAEMMKEYRKKRFIEDASTLVALLVINDRKDEAESAAAKYKTVEADADFHDKLAKALDQALEGKLPEAR